MPDLSKVTDWTPLDPERRKKLGEITDWQPIQSSETRKVREATWPEWFGSQALRIIPPVGAGLLASETGPLGMIAATAAASGVGETAAEAFEKWRGIREDINPYQIGVQTVIGGIPLPGGKVPGVGATAEEFIKHAWRAPVRGAAEGFLLGAGASVPSALAEGETPTLGGALQGGIGGAGFGAAGGAAFGSIPSVMKANRLKAIADVPPPHPLSHEFNQRIPLDPIKPGSPESPILPFYPEDDVPTPPSHIPVSEADTASTLSSQPRVVSVQDPTPLRLSELRQRGYEVWEGHFNNNGDQQMIRRDLLPPESRVAPLPDQSGEFSLTGQSPADLAREADIRAQTVERAREIQREQQIPFDEAHQRAIAEHKQNAFIEQVTPEMGPPRRPPPPDGGGTPVATGGESAGAVVQRVSARVQAIMQERGVSVEEARSIAASEYAQSVIAKEQAEQPAAQPTSTVPVDANGVHEQVQSSAASNAMLKAQGFEPIGRVSKAGNALWRRVGVQSRPTPPPPENTIPSMGDTVPFHPDDNVVVEEAKVNKTLINNMAEDGMYPSGRDEQGRIIFSRREGETIVDPAQESRVPRIPTSGEKANTGQRIKILEQQINEAYQRNDINAVVDLSQQLDRIKNPMPGAEDRLLGPNNSLGRAQGSSSYPRARVSDADTSMDAYTTRMSEESRAARASQEARARELGINPEGVGSDELSRRIALTRHWRGEQKPDLPQESRKPPSHPLDSASGHGSVRATAESMVKRARTARPDKDPHEYASMDATYNMMSNDYNSRNFNFWKAVQDDIGNLKREGRQGSKYASLDELFEIRQKIVDEVDQAVSALTNERTGESRARVANIKKRLAQLDQEIHVRRGGKVIDPNEHPIVTAFRNNLEPTNDTDLAYFILPDGTMLAGNGAGIHRQIASSIGVDLDEALAAGIIRYRMDGAEVGAPITHAQAVALHDAITTRRDNALYLDVFYKKGTSPEGLELSPKVLGIRDTPDGIRNWVNSHFKDDLPQEMRVKGVREGNTKLENVAMGGADERVLDVLGNSLYTKPRPVVAIKELLQNAFDEHKIAGVQDHVRIHIEHTADNPITPGGDKGRSITVRDRGRGLMPDQIYTILTDVGKTGKAGEESAAGGFGFAKASPFLGGKWSQVVSVVDTPKGRMRYSMEGTPAQLKKQSKGVPLNAEKVGKDVPTGLEFHVWYPADQPGFWQVQSWARNMTERSSSVKGGIKMFDSYGSRPVEVRRWLDETPQNPIGSGEYNYPKTVETIHTSQPIPTLQDTLTTPGANVNIHYDIEPGVETAGADIHLGNKGMYQGTNDINYGEQTANVPRSIVADIIATVEEGHTDYPFSANREQLSDDVNDAINKWVKDNIVTGITQKRVAAIQKQYDAIDYFHQNGESGVQFLDDGNKFTPEELEIMQNHPILTRGIQALENVHKELLSIADKLGWSPVSYSATFRKPSDRLQKFGLLFAGPDSKGTTMGIHIPRPDDMNNSAILINLMEHLNTAALADAPIDQLKSDLFTTLAHEQAHIPGGPHDKDFAYRDAQLRGKLGAGNTIALINAIGKEFDDGRGNLSPELSEVLRIYNESRQRPDGGPNAVLATGTPQQRPPIGTTGKAQIPPSTGTGKDKPRSIIREALNFPRAATTPLDLSAGMRQGLPLITTKAWWTSWRQQIQALGSEKAYQKTLADIKKRPMFQARRDMNPNSPTYGKVTKSFAEQAGMKLSDVSHLGAREESVASTWIENGQMFGKDNPVQRGYKTILGNPIRASNRAYTAFLNQLRADTFESLIKDASRDFKAGTKGARDPLSDLLFAKEIADFVNTATGKGPMKLARPTISEGKLGLKESNLEQNAQLFTDTLFAPRLFFSRARMLNPMTYMMATPFVRKQYLKSALSVAGAWATFSGLGYMAGQSGLADVDVSLDPNSADFGKMRIGNTRLDPAGGFQQYFVALSRLISGRTTSSATGRDTELGAGFQADTRKDIAERFMVNKLNPVVKFAWDLMDASQYQPFHVGDRSAQLFVPLIIQDVIELSKEDPSLLPLIAPIAAGMGSQTYSKGETSGRIIPPENDWILEGGDPRQMTQEDILPDWAQEIQ